MPKLALLGGPKTRRQPFSRWPYWDAAERKALLGVLAAGSWGGYPSPNARAKRFEDEFARAMGARHAVLCANGSLGLELALMAAGLSPGDEVIVPAYTFVATASSVAFCRGVPVFADIDPKTYCLDPRAAEAAVTPRTKAIIVVHLACNMADMDAFARLAKRRGLVLIEDCAHSPGARWKGRSAGTLGDFGVFSFQTSKLMTAGEGGLVVAAGRERADRLRSLVNCGRKEPGYDSFRGRLLGKNCRLAEWEAAILSVQLKRLGAQARLREARASRLERRLSGMEGIAFTARDPRNDRRALYQLIVKYDPKGFRGLPRDRFVAALNAEGIPAEGDFYVPLYKDELFAMDPATNPLASAAYAQGFDLERFRCPVAEKAAYEEAVWLPHPLFLGPERDVDDVARAFEKIKDNLDALCRRS